MISNYKRTLLDTLVDAIQVWPNDVKWEFTSSRFEFVMQRDGRIVAISRYPHNDEMVSFKSWNKGKLLKKKLDLLKQIEELEKELKQ